MKELTKIQRGKKYAFFQVHRKSIMNLRNDIKMAGNLKA